MTTEYTKRERQQMARAFRLAGERIWNGEFVMSSSRYICHALLDMYMGDRIPGFALNACRDVIRDRLQVPSIEQWLHEHGFVEYWQVLPNSNIWPQIQAYRKRWCLALAEEFSQ